MLHSATAIHKSLTIPLPRLLADPLDMDVQPVPLAAHPPLTSVDLVGTHGVRAGRARWIEVRQLLKVLAEDGRDQRVVSNRHGPVQEHQPVPLKGPKERTKGCFQRCRHLLGHRIRTA